MVTVLSLVVSRMFHSNRTLMRIAIPLKGETDEGSKSVEAGGCVGELLDLGAAG